MLIVNFLSCFRSSKLYLCQCQSKSFVDKDSISLTQTHWDCLMHCFDCMLGQAWKLNIFPTRNSQYLRVVERCATWPQFDLLYLFWSHIRNVTVQMPDWEEVKCFECLTAFNLNEKRAEMKSIAMLSQKPEEKHQDLSINQFLHFLPITLTLFSQWR